MNYQIVRVIAGLLRLIGWFSAVVFFVFFLASSEQHTSLLKRPISELPPPPRFEQLQKDIVTGAFGALTGLILVALGYIVRLASVISHDLKISPSQLEKNGATAPPSPDSGVLDGYSWWQLPEGRVEGKMFGRIEQFNSFEEFKAYVQQVGPASRYTPVA